MMKNHFTFEWTVLALKRRGSFDDDCFGSSRLYKYLLSKGVVLSGMLCIRWIQGLSSVPTLLLLTLSPVIANEGVDVTCFDAPINWHRESAYTLDCFTFHPPSTFQYYKCSHLLHCSSFFKW